jgi:acetyl-CoA C-acetyltransferase
MPGVLEPRTGLSMGEHCEQMAKTWKISRADQDALANASHVNAGRGVEARLLQRPRGGRVPGTQHGQQRARRQHGREARVAQARVDRRSGQGTLTAGNSTPLTDGASAV